MNEVLFTQTSCIILAAGSSSRMGMHKALLKFDEETAFIQKITHTYIRAGCEQVIVVTNAELYKQVKESNLYLFNRVELVVNDNPDLGRFYSLQTGVKQLKPCNYCFFQNIDNPYTTIELLKALMVSKNEADIIIPVVHQKQGHPVLFSPLVSSEILKTDEYKTRIDQFFKKFSVQTIETRDTNILVNINSLEEYLAAGFRF